MNAKSPQQSIKDDESGDCPKCGYPRLGEYLGIYKPGVRCDKCGYLDIEEAKKENEKFSKLKEKSKNLNKSPIKFKSYEDYVNWYKQNIKDQ